MNKERRKNNYFNKLAQYYKKLFYMLLQGIKNHDENEIKKAEILMQASEDINF